MQIDINLLPQKEKTHDYPKVWSIGFAVTGVLIAAIIGSLSFIEANNLDRVEKELAQVTEVRSTMEANASTFTASSSYQQLSSTIQWANEYPVVSSAVLEHLVSLLPERGFFQQYGYSETGTISLTVQFDTSREVAFYLDRLLGSESIENATLLSISTQEMEETARDVLPRYIGTFDIVLKPDAFRKMEKEEQTP